MEPTGLVFRQRNCPRGPGDREESGHRRRPQAQLARARPNFGSCRQSPHFAWAYKEGAHVSPPQPWCGQPGVSCKGAERVHIQAVSYSSPRKLNSGP